LIGPDAQSDYTVVSLLAHAPYDKSTLSVSVRSKNGRVCAEIWSKSTGDLVALGQMMVNPSDEALILECCDILTDRVIAIVSLKKTTMTPPLSTTPIQSLDVPIISRPISPAETVRIRHRSPSQSIRSPEPSLQDFLVSRCTPRKARRSVSPKVVACVQTTPRSVASSGSDAMAKYLHRLEQSPNVICDDSPAVRRQFERNMEELDEITKRLQGFKEMAGADRQRVEPVVSPAHDHPPVTSAPSRRRLCGKSRSKSRNLRKRRSVVRKVSAPTYLLPSPSYCESVIGLESNLSSPRTIIPSETVLNSDRTTVMVPSSSSVSSTHSPFLSVSVGIAPVTISAPAGNTIRITQERREINFSSLSQLRHESIQAARRNISQVRVLLRKMEKSSNS
jgi:hypothetical protein